MRRNLLAKKGLVEHDEPKNVDIKDRYRSEWSTTFEELMRNRLVMGSLHYKTFKQRRSMSPSVDFAREAVRRLFEYLNTGNKEFLVDAANMCLLEFEFPFQTNTFHDREVEHNVHVV